MKTDDSDPKARHTYIETVSRIRSDVVFGLPHIRRLKYSWDAILKAEECAATEIKLAQSDLKAEQAQVEKLNGELSSTRALIDTFEQRVDQLQRRHFQLELIAPRGNHFRRRSTAAARTSLRPGHRDLSRRTDRTERCTRRPSGALESAGFSRPTFPRSGLRIAGESEPDQHRRMTYRVELTIENSAGRLRPGMTAFARIDFDRQMIGRIILHKLRQSLRPELWML